MAEVPKRIAERLSAGLKRFQPILHSAHARDLNESDTVVIVTDILHDILGYDKYSEITSEQRIRGTFCDLVVKIDNSPALLIEVKAIGLELKDQFIRQAVDYAANQGVDWVVLTNGVCWNVYKVSFTKPIEHELVVALNFLKLNPRSEADLELLALLAKEGWQKARLGDYHSQRQALSRFSIAAILLTDPVIAVIRRELRRVSGGILVEPRDLERALVDDVLKRDVLEGEKAEVAKRQVARSAGKALRACTDGASGPPQDTEQESKES